MSCQNYNATLFQDENIASSRYVLLNVSLKPQRSRDDDDDDGDDTKNSYLK